ncbi:transcriptional regulator [Streptosporangium sp. NPDC006930]|uniref:ArsR/SmtB family transcription factor n=1 Tax=unclassified Streptosporangium TaxID=2632669 RepID=UPI00342C4644
MLRIHFSAEDLLRIRVQAEPNVMWEVLLSLHMVQTGYDGRVFGPWRRAVRSRLAPSVGLLRTLARPRGYSPDFLTPSADVADLDTGLELVMSTSRTRLRADIASLADQVALPTWVSGVADGEPETMRRLRDALRAYHAEALEPYWPSIRRYVRADQKKRVEAVMGNGFESLFDSFYPIMRWRAPVLEVVYPIEWDLHLEGRGLTLVPSFFCWPGPITLANQSGPPVLVYPVQKGPAQPLVAETERTRERSLRSLVALMGQTRAEVLREIAERNHVNTTELAQTLGISLAGASQHAAVLRNAGLVTTARHRGSALHKVSNHGAALLHSAASPVGH